MYLFLVCSLDAYLREIEKEQQGLQPQYDYGGNGDLDLMDLAAAPLDQVQAAPVNSEDAAVANENASSAYSEMSEVLMHREKEFLGFLCQPLETLEEYIAEAAIEALADELRAKVKL